MKFKSFVMTISRNEFHQHYCRVCGSNNGICVNLFTKEGKSYLIKVQSLLNIEINKTDHLPKNICHVCISFISDFDEYRKHCRIVQDKMKNLANNFINPKDAVVESTKRLPLVNNGTPMKTNVDKAHSNTIQNGVPVEKIRSVDNTGLTLANNSTPTKQNVDTAHSMTINNKKIRSVDNTVNSRTEIEKEEPQTTNSICDSVLNELKSNSEPNVPNDWTIQTLRDSNTTLYVCNRCNAMLLSESAIISHECSWSNSSHILSSNPSYKLPQENDNMKKTKRKKIVFYEDD